MKIKIKEIEMDEDLYPRGRPKKSIIEKYVKDMEISIFPPIVIQKVKDGKKVYTICLDGWHRIEARKWRKEKEIEAVFWKDTILDKKKDFNILLEECVRRNRSHGVRLKDKEIKDCCERIIDRTPDKKLVGIQKRLAKMLQVSESWISQNVGSKIKTRKEVRDALIVGQRNKGVAVKVVAKESGVSEARVHQIVKKLTSEEIIETRNKKMAMDFYFNLNLFEAYNINQVLQMHCVGYSKDLIIKQLDLVAQAFAFNMYNKNRGRVHKWEILDYIDNLFDKLDQQQNVIKSLFDTANGNAHMQVREVMAYVNGLLSPKSIEAVEMYIEIGAENCMKKLGI